MSAKPRLPAFLAAVVLAAAAGFGSHFEGRRLTAYQDVAGIWSICDGHTAGVKPGDTATDEQCQAWLQQEMGEALATVQRCVGRPMPLHVAIALTDFTYNEGAGAKGGKDGFCILKSGRPSTIRVLAQKGDWAGVCDQLRYWTKADGVEYQGLVVRREMERRICLGEPL